MKSLITSILILALIFTSVFVMSNAIKIDSAEQALEWKNAECIEIISRADSNKVDFSLLKYYSDSNGYDAYFLLYLTDSKSEKNDKCGFIFSLGNDFEITITSDKATSVFDNNLYNVDYKFNIIEEDGVYCEMKVAFKKGLPATVNGTVSFIDGEGNNSYYYPFSFENYVETTAINTIEKTTVKPTVKTSEKTTKEKTTKEKTTSKPKTTKQTTTQKAKTTSAKKSENKTVVYFYEKEVYISQVFVSETSVSDLNTVSEESTTAAATTAIASTERSFQISEGVTAQKIICALGGAVLITFAAWAGLSAKKKTDNAGDEAKKSDKSDNN